MFNKPFAKIEIEDINELVYERKERENNNLEYKQKLNDSNKLKLLKAVSGFANASGGFLIIGVTEKDDGTPDKICGIENKIGNQKIDEWINNVLISNINEKVRYESKVFNISDDKVVVILYIPESPKKPHMVTFNEKNTYFIRHNTSVDPATQSEVREMFEYSKKHRDEFEEFLKKRNIFDEDNENFGINENSNLLFNRMVKEKGIKKPIILYSFIPRYLKEDKVNTISHEFLDWLIKNHSGFEPIPQKDLFSISTQKVNLYGIVYPKIKYIENIKENELYENYFEILNNGFFESGISGDVFFSLNKHEQIYNAKEVKAQSYPALSLTSSIGYLWSLFNFAKFFYQKINYYDEVIFQLSVVNVKNYILCGFGRKNTNKKWFEPFNNFYNDPPCCTHEKFKIIEKFIVSELSDESIREYVFNISENLSRAFGESVVKCFDDDGNFNNKDMMYFRYR